MGQGIFQAHAQGAPRWDGLRVHGVVVRDEWSKTAAWYRKQKTSLSFNLSGWGAPGELVSGIGMLPLMWECYRHP